MSLAKNTESLQALLDAVKDLPEFALPKKTSITFAAASWAESNGVYQQTVTVNGGTANSLIALQPTAAQVVALQGYGVAALMVDNDNGTFIARAVGAKPSAGMNIQATVTEVAT